MKKPEEYLENIPTFTDIGGYGKEYVLEAISLAQVDAYKEAIQWATVTVEKLMREQNEKS